MMGRTSIKGLKAWYASGSFANNSAASMFFYLSNTAFSIDVHFNMYWLPTGLSLGCGWSEPVHKFSRKAIAQDCTPNPLGKADQFCDVVNA